MSFEPLTLFLVFVFGTIIGSFLNVVIYRFNTGKGLLGRSRCFSCHKKLSWYELIPILSFLFQKGRCISCKCKISWQYPLVEFLTGAVFALFFWKFFIKQAFFLTQINILFFFFYLVIFSILLVIAVYDLRHAIIPNMLVYIFILLAFFVFVLDVTGAISNPFFTFSLNDILAPLVLFSFFGGLWFFSKGMWIGFGDAKLSVGIGFLLGWKASVIAFLISFWVGAIVGIYLLSLRRYSFTMKSEIPFGPFLILGTFTAFLISPIFFIF